MPRYKLDQFIWTASERTLSVEISSLARAGTSAFGFVTATHSGFEIESHITGAIQTYVITHVEWSREQEILEWWLRSDDSDIKVVVYND